MPKKAFSINKFSGLQTEPGPRDIAPGALVKADDVFIDKPGKIRLARVSSTYSPGDDIVVNTATYCYRGYGLFQFSSDYEMNGTQAAANTDYLLVQQGSAFSIAENYNSSDYDNDTDLLTADEESTDFAIGTDDGSVKPCYYYTDGALRICDGNFFNMNNTPKWLGYINRQHFEGLTPTTSCSYNGWYLNDQEISAPTAGTIWEDGADQYPSAGTGIGFYALPQYTGTCNMPTGEYAFALSFVYDDNQESKLYEYTETVTLTDIGKIGFYACLTNPFNPRITSGNLYIKNIDNGDDWIFVAKISLLDGVYNSSDINIAEWAYSTAPTIADTLITSGDGQGDTFTVRELSSITYEMNSGISPDENNIFATYKTACIANRRAYIGNVYIDGVAYGDKMLKSPVGKFDIFPESNNIDVVINDGDEIVKLVALSDRILQFKRRNLYVINIADDYEYIEETYELRGTEKPYRICKFGNTVAWCNQFGVYAYSDGKLQEISASIKDDWQDFFAADSSNSNVSIGYNEIQKKIVIINSVGYKSGEVTENTGNSYVYDITNGSWTKSRSMFDTLALGEDYTNFVTDVDGDMLVFKEDATPENSTLKHLLTTDKSTSNVNITTGDLAIEDISIKKRFYGIRITYKATGNTETDANIKLLYGIDGISPATIFTDNSSLKCTNGLWKTEERTVSPTNFYSIAIKIYSGGTCASGFEINDISIVYRPIGVR